VCNGFEREMEGSIIKFSWFDAGMSDVPDVYTTSSVPGLFMPGAVYPLECVKLYTFGKTYFIVDGN